MRLRHRAQCLELGREQGLVDLALVDRHAFLDAHPNYFLPVDPEFLRELFGREVIRHCRCLLRHASNEKARWRNETALRRAPAIARSSFAGINGPASPKLP